MSGWTSSDSILLAKTMKLWNKLPGEVSRSTHIHYIALRSLDKHVSSQESADCNLGK